MKKSKGHFQHILLCCQLSTGKVVNLSNFHQGRAPIPLEISPTSQIETVWSETYIHMQNWFCSKSHSSCDSSIEWLVCTLLQLETGILRILWPKWNQTSIHESLSPEESIKCQGTGDCLLFSVVLCLCWCVLLLFVFSLPSYLSTISLFFIYLFTFLTQFTVNKLYHTFLMGTILHWGAKFFLVGGKRKTLTCLYL